MQISQVDFKQEQIFTSAASIRSYIHGGRAEVLLVAPSGLCHKYLFECPKDREAFPPNYTFVYVIHEDHKFYIGLLDGNRFRVTAHSKWNADTPIVKGAFYISYMAMSQELVDKTQMVLMHTGRCCRCGRTLTSTKALKAGIGRNCAKYFRNNVEDR